MKKNSGITLIALVITIIVLLILAGVALAMISGNGGILGKASSAKIENQIGEIKDNIAMDVTTALTDFYEDAYVTATAETQNQDVDEYIQAKLTKTYSITSVATVSAFTYDSTAKTITFTITPTDKTVQVYNGTITDGVIAYTRTANS